MLNFMEEMGSLEVRKLWKSIGNCRCYQFYDEKVTGDVRDG